MKMILKAFLVLAISSVALGADNLIGDGTSGSWQLLDNSNVRWNAHLVYTTNGNSDVFTLGGESASGDNIIGDASSGNHQLIDNAGKRWGLDVVYTTDGSGNVIPISGGGSSYTFSAPLVNTAGTVSIPLATSSVDGYLSHTDRATFNAKQPAGSYITALTGDVTASGPGSSAATLATVNSNVGSYSLANVTVNAKGLVTAASSGSSAINNYFWIAPNGVDSAGCGAITSPCATFGQVATNIGSAASNADFNDATKQFYYVKANGTFTESPTFGTRPHIVLDLSSAVITGDVTWQFNQGAIFGANNQQPRLSIIGADLRAGYGGLFGYSGVNGNVFIESTGSGSSLVAQLHMINTGVTGDIHQRLGSGGGIFTLSAFLTGTMVTGKVICDTSPSAGSLTLYANNSDSSGGRAIGGATGSVQLYQMHNVRIVGPVVVSSPQGGRWFDVQFASAAHDFSGSSGTTSMDANTFESWTANVPTKGSVATALLDTARGVGYSPLLSTNWSGAPATVSAALDKLVVLQQSAVGSQPACDSAHRGLSWLVQGGAGVADIYQVCQKDVADAYVWTTH